MAEAGRLPQPHDLPVGPTGRQGLGSWGVGTLIASEAALFSYLLFSYYYTGATAPGWLLERTPEPQLALPNTILLLASSVAAWWGERGILSRRRPQALLGFGRGVRHGRRVRVRAVSRMAHRSPSASAPRATPRSTSSPPAFTWRTCSSDCWCCRALCVDGARLLQPATAPDVTAGVFYWHFVDVVWLFVFTTYYLTPYLGFGR